jgi:hypothetical protein
MLASDYQNNFIENKDLAGLGLLGILATSVVFNTSIFIARAGK